MIADFNSDDESDELNRIRDKLRRNTKSGGGDSSEDLDVDSDDETKNQSHIKSKHWTSITSSSKLNKTAKSKQIDSTEVNKHSTAWHQDDDDDVFDAKLAAMMNVLPIMKTSCYDGDNPYRNNRSHRTSHDTNSASRLPPSTNRNIQQVLPQQLSVGRPVVTDEDVNDSNNVITSLNYKEPLESEISSSFVIKKDFADGSQEPNSSNRIKNREGYPRDRYCDRVSKESHVVNRINPYTGTVDNASIQPKNPSIQQKNPNVLPSSESIETLQYDDYSSKEIPPSHDTKSKHGVNIPCQYEDASDNINWYDDEATVDETHIQQSIQLDGLNVDAFGFEIEPEVSPNFGESTKRSHHSSTDANRLAPKDGSAAQNPTQGSSKYNSEIPTVHYGSVNVHQSHDLVDDAFGFVDRAQYHNDEAAMVEKPVDESLCARDGSEDRISEVDPSLYAPLATDVIREPIVYFFTPRNRPLHARNRIPVAQVFPPPISLLWMNKFDVFNEVQSELTNMLAYSDDNVVISAPTGAGKTAVFEMTIARFFGVDIQATQPDQANTPSISKRRKIVYIAPSKALCEERFSDWSKRLSSMNLGIEMAVVTGDSDPSDALHDVAASHFILSTPEKWDSLTRRWTEKFFLFASVKLFLVDEVHLIADESRGCCLEAIVCRMKTIQRAATKVSVTQEEIAVSSYTNTTPDAINSLLRFVAVSATLPNITDIAMFFEANEAHVFDESYRPVPLTTHVIGQGKLTTDGKSGQFMFWKNLDRNVPELIIKHSNRRPTIVFCHSKAECEKLADLLATTHNIGRRDDTTSGIACQTRVSKLQRVLINAVAYHHAGLDVDDRHLVEESFSSGLIRVLCATSTLAMGVNLPAHLVIVKGTSAYRGTGEGGGYQDIDQASLLQMIGRAGRPGFDKTGTAVIMTDNDSKARIEKLASSGLPTAKSQLIGSKLIETINAEVSQRVITCVESARNWIKGTLYYIQLVQEPEAYGVRVVSNFSIDTYMFNICQTVVERLRVIGALATSSSEEIYPRVASHIMSHRLVSYNAMNAISQIPFDATHGQILRTVAMMDGLHCPVRRSEKKALNTVHKELKMYKLDGPLSKVRIQEPWQKAFVLLQVYIEELDFEGFDYVMRQEMNSIVEYSTRILSAIEELSLKGTMNGNLLVQCLKIRRSLAVHCWSAKDGALRQIKGIGKALSFSLLMSGISTFDDVMNHTEVQIEKVANRPHPFGTDLRKATSSILQSRLVMSASIERGVTANSPSVCTCVLTTNCEQTGEVDFIEKAIPILYTLVVYIDKESGILLGKQNIVGPETFKIVLPPSFAPLHVQLIASIIGLDEIVVLDDEEKSVQPVTTTGRSTIEVPSKKRIRDSTNRIYDIVGSRRADVVKPTKLTKEKRDNTEATQLPDAASNIGIFLGAAEQTSVTPSPHLTPTPNYSQNVASTVTKNLVHYMPSQLAKSNFDHRNSPATTNDPTSYPVSHHQQRTHTPTFHGRSHMSGYGVDIREPSNHAWEVTQSHSIQSTLNQPHLSKRLKSQQQAINYSDSWKRLKSQQQKSQQRAFVRRSDNPFKNYKHDPNDTESYLDQLVSHSKDTTPTSESIIPPEGFRAIDAGRRQPYFFSNNSNIDNCRTNSKEMFVRRKHQTCSTVSMQDLLSQKAAESNVQVLGGTHYANNGGFPIYSTEPIVHPLQYQNSSSFPLHDGLSQLRAEDYFGNHLDAGYSPYDQTLQHNIIDSDLYSHRNIEVRNAGVYTNQANSLGHDFVLHETQHPHLQRHMQQVSNQTPNGRRDKSDHYSIVDRENMENSFFF